MTDGRAIGIGRGRARGKGVEYIYESTDGFRLLCCRAPGPLRAVTGHFVDHVGIGLPALWHAVRADQHEYLGLAWVAVVMLPACSVVHECRPMCDTVQTAFDQKNNFSIIRNFHRIPLAVAHTVFHAAYVAQGD